MMERSEIASVAEQIRQRESLLRSAAGFGSSLFNLIADHKRLEAARAHGFDSSFQMIVALNRAHTTAIEWQRQNTNLLHSLAGMQEAASLAAAMRARIEESIADVALSDPMSGLLSGLTSLTNDATRIWDRFAKDPQTLVALPEFLRKRPIEQVSWATRTTGLIVTADSDFIKEPSPLAADAGEVEMWLARVNPALVELYRGAIARFNQRGPDYVRQVTISLRELLVHLFREIAPKQAIEAWDASVLPATGKVTYRAHLLYVFRGPVRSKAYAKMAAHDIDHILQTFFALDGEGVHKLTPDLEYEEVRLLINRCEYNLLTILRAHELSAGAGLP